MTSDHHLTTSLIIDILDVLERHGHHQHDTQHTGQAIAIIGDLVRVYEGTRDVPYGTYLGPAPPPPHPEPGQPAAEADQDAVVLPSADVRTVLFALDEAADRRDRAETCAYCADQSCPDCHTRLQAAQAYDRLADRPLHPTRAAHASQPEPDSPGTLPGHADPEADREAGH